MLTRKESEWEGLGEHAQARLYAGEVQVFLVETPDTRKHRLCLSFVP